MNELPPPKVLASGKYLRLVAQGHWEFAERVNATGAVAIVALSDTRQLVLVEQYRIPVRCRVIELPAGLVGDVPERRASLTGQFPSDESSAPPADPVAVELAEAAHRELLEETGYEAAEMRLLGGGPPSAGLSNEVVTFFHARGLRRLSRGGGVDHEQIVVHEPPLADLDAWLKQRSADGLMIDPKIFAGLYLWQRAGIG
jgi:ADP-ribose pyrophosphatase